MASSGVMGPNSGQPPPLPQMLQRRVASSGVHQGVSTWPLLVNLICSSCGNGAAPFLFHLPLRVYKAEGLFKGGRGLEAFSPDKALSFNIYGPVRVIFDYYFLHCITTLWVIVPVLGSTVSVTAYPKTWASFFVFSAPYWATSFP